MTVAFDVDDTLIVPGIVTGLGYDTPNYENIALLKWFQRNGHHVIVWSGGGVDYARMWADKLGLIDVDIAPKTATFGVDIAFDDCDVDLAKVNVKVKRYKNSVSRKEWNKHQ